MILEDFVMLGTTVPEPRSDGRVFVCSAGVSPELRKLVRIYPLAKWNIPHRWDIHRVPVERNPKDSRWESWKIKAPRDVEHHSGVNLHFEKLGTVTKGKRQEMLSKYVVSGVGEANEKRLSLAIIHPKRAEVYFKYNPDSPDSPELGLFEDDQQKRSELGAKRFLWMPRLKFEDETGGHDWQIRDWGSYELMRKRGYDYAKEHLAKALHLSESSSLLVGNMNNHRTTWLIISVLNGLREEPTLFDEGAE